MTTQILLAILEHQGLLSSEMAEMVDGLTNDVVPLNYDAARTLVRDAIGQLPVWDSCPNCRSLISQYKVALYQHHAAGHPDIADAK